MSETVEAFVWVAVGGDVVGIISRENNFLEIKYDFLVNAIPELNY